MTATAVAVDPSSTSRSLIVVGWFEQQLRFYLNGSTDAAQTLTAKGAKDAFVARFDQGGDGGSPVSLFTAKNYGESLDQEATAVAVSDDGDVVVAGQFAGELLFEGQAKLTAQAEQDIFVALLRSDGEPKWAKRFGLTHRQRVDAIAFDPEGNIVLKGLFEGSIRFGSETLEAFYVGAGGGEHWDLYVAKLDPDGEHLWSHSYGRYSEKHPSMCMDQDVPCGQGLTTGPNGHIWLTGWFEGAVSFGEQTWSPVDADGYLVRLAP